jgi:hypothetical protein
LSAKLYSWLIFVLGILLLQALRARKKAVRELVLKIFLSMFLPGDYMNYQFNHIIFFTLLQLIFIKLFFLLIKKAINSKI